MSAGCLGLSGGTATRALLIGSGAAADGEHCRPDEVGLLVALRGASLLPGADDAQHAGMGFRQKGH